MGFRLYVNDELSCGKLYRYNCVVKHLYSIDYLISIGAFDEWVEPPYEVPSYDYMVDYFCYIQATDDIYLNPDEYRRFILLYTSDQIEEYNTDFGNDLNAICEILNERLSVKPNKNGKIKLCWE